MKWFTKVLFGCCLLVSICTKLAYAADEHPAKTEHFSMLELNRKLSALILEKYQNAYIDSDVFSINACNSQLMKDTSTDNHSCLDSQVKPLPDSADFILHLSVGVDFNHQQKILYSPGSFDVSKSVTGKRYNFKVLPERTDGESPAVPYESWIYGAFNKLVWAGVTVPTRFNSGPSLIPVSRYEFAVAIARLLDNKLERAKDTPEVKELIGELAVEFAPKIAYLSTPLDRGLLEKVDPKDGKHLKPRFGFLQLQFYTGNQFDPKLRKQIEDTIADYAAVWLKSNSSTAAAAARK